MSAQVLIVDDDKLNRTILVRNLAMWDVSCDEAENGVDALEMTTRREYSLIVMDIRMPSMDGNETASLMRLHGVRCPILAVTGEGNDVDTKYFDSMVEKPVTRARLRDAFEELGLL